jgi:MHS family alpha-ketoglutarate permease-like MFS transporter
LPFFFGAALGVIVIWMRRALPESLHEEEKAGADTEEPSVWGGVRKHWVGLVAILFVVGAAQAYNYAWNVGLPNLARSAYKENSTWVFAITSILGAILVFGSLVTGRMADKWKVSRVFLIARLLAIPSVFLMLFYNAPGLGGFAAVILGGSVVLVLNMTMYNLVSTSLMPKYCRATGVALGYGVAVALFGGTASYLLVWMQQQGISWMFPVYVAVLSAISVVLYLVARRTSGIYAGE